MGLSSLRSVLPYGDQEDIDTLQLNPISKAVFGVATVRFEVRACSWDIESRGNV